MKQNFWVKPVLFYERFSCQFTFSHSSHSLNDRWGIKDDQATTFLHSSVSSAFRGASPNPNPVHTSPNPNPVHSDMLIT